MSEENQEVYIWEAESNGVRGFAAVRVEGSPQFFPLVAYSLEEAEALESKARHVLRNTGAKVFLSKFTRAEVVKTMELARDF